MPSSSKELQSCGTGRGKEGWYIPTLLSSSQLHCPW